MQTIKLQS